MKKTLLKNLKQWWKKKLGLPAKNQRYTFNAKHVEDGINFREFLGEEIFKEGWCNMNLYYKY